MGLHNSSTAARKALTRKKAGDPAMRDQAGYRPRPVVLARCANAPGRGHKPRSDIYLGLADGVSTHRPALLRAP